VTIVQQTGIAAIRVKRQSPNYTGYTEVVRAHAHPGDAHDKTRKGRVPGEGRRINVMAEYHWVHRYMSEVIGVDNFAM